MADDDDEAEEDDAVDDNELAAVRPIQIELLALRSQWDDVRTTLSSFQRLVDVGNRTNETGTDRQHNPQY